MAISTSKVLAAVYDERVRQDKKWGQQNWSPSFYLAILAEEFGEVAKEAVEYTIAGLKGNESARMFRRTNIVKELIQVAAVAVAWIEAIDRHDCGVAEACPCITYQTEHKHAGEQA